MPNKSFDLARLSCSMIEALYHTPPEPLKNVIPIAKESNSRIYYHTKDEL